jgi:hypothetical protein
LIERFYATRLHFITVVNWTSYNIYQSNKTAVAVQDQKYQGDFAMQISSLIRLNYVPKIFPKQDLAVAKARVIVFSYISILIFQVSWRWDSSSSSSILYFCLTKISSQLFHHQIYFSASVQTPMCTKNCKNQKIKKGKKSGTTKKQPHTIVGFIPPK